MTGLFHKVYCLWEKVFSLEKWVRLLDKTKVDKDGDKGLSDANFTFEEKAKLALITNNNPGGKPLTVIDDLVTQDIENPLSANQGYVLNNLINANSQAIVNKSDISDIVDDLNTNNTNKPLSAKQGKELKDLVETKEIALKTLIDTKEAELSRRIQDVANAGGTGNNTSKSVAYPIEETAYFQSALGNNKAGLYVAPSTDPLADYYLVTPMPGKEHVITFSGELNEGLKYRDKSYNTVVEPTDVQFVFYSSGLLQSEIGYNRFKEDYDTLPIGTIVRGANSPKIKMSNNKVFTDFIDLVPQQSVGGQVPAGVILMWSGTINNIPTGWVICDGNNNTPDLRGRFIAGYDSRDPEFNSIGKIGGESKHTLTSLEMPTHSHGMDNSGEHRHEYLLGEGNVGSAARNSGTEAFANYNRTTASGNHRHTIHNTGGGMEHENLPPYYSLAFIMKL